MPLNGVRRKKLSMKGVAQDLKVGYKTLWTKHKGNQAARIRKKLKPFIGKKQTMRNLDLEKQRLISRARRNLK